MTKLRITKSKGKYGGSDTRKGKVKARRLKTYRKAQPDFEMESGIVLRSIPTLSEHAENLPVYNTITNDSDSVMCIRVTVLADLLNCSYQTVWRWINKTDLLPKPVLVDKSRGREDGVYDLREAEIILRAVGEHLRAFKYYRKDHANTRSRIFAEIQKLRETIYAKPIGGTNGRKISRKKTRRNN